MSKLIEVILIVSLLIGGVFYVVTKINNPNPSSNTITSQPNSNSSTLNQNNGAANDVATTDTSLLDQHSNDDISDGASLNDALSSL